MDRRAFLAGTGGVLLAAPLAADAQQAGKVYRIGMLAAKVLPDPEFQALSDQFTQGLRSHGWIEGQNITIVRRFAEGLERYPAVAAELATLRPDVIVTGLGEPAIAALKNATTTIPIVMLVSADPVGAGLVASLARPGGNITGMSILAPEMGGKRLEILKRAVPGAARVAVLWNTAYQGKAAEFRDTQATAVALKVTLQSVEVRERGDFDRNLSIIGRHRPDAMVVFSDPLTISHRRQIIEYTTKFRLPMISEVREFAQAGALMSYGANLADLFWRAAGHVDKILKGARPADIPVEQPTKFELVINLKTAKALGLTIPQSVLGRADEIVQ
jgi:putative tryptophan/tyrosine transport system substrate-binding protein